MGDWLRRMGDPQPGHAELLGLGQVRDALTARLLHHAGRVGLRLVLEAEALACWRTIRQRCGALGGAPCVRETVATLWTGE